MQDVWVSGAGMTGTGRRGEPLAELMAEAALAALAMAGLERPQAIVVAAMNPEEFVGDGNFASNVASHMGFADVPTLRVETATSSGAAAFYAGFAQVASGLCSTVLVVGGEKMTHVATPRVSELIGRSIDPYERSYGATSVVLTSTRGPVRVAGVGQGTDTLALRHRHELTSFRATQTAARAAFTMAGFGPARVDFAELHDAFAPFELIALEDIGLVPPGKSGAITLNGETALDGRLPINPSGGLKARGHPLAATGLAQIVECVWQLSGRAEGRQLSARIGLAHSIGGLATNNWITLLEASR